MKYFSLFVLALLATACSSTKTKPSDESKTQALSAASNGEKHSKEAEAKDSAPKGMVICQHKNDERTLEIVSEKTGCIVKYTKNQASKNIASDSHGDKHCQNVVKKIKGNLVSAGFNCK